MRDTNVYEDVADIRVHAQELISVAELSCMGRAGGVCARMYARCVVSHVAPARRRALRAAASQHVYGTARDTGALAASTTNVARGHGGAVCVAVRTRAFCMCSAVARRERAGALVAHAHEVCALARGVATPAAWRPGARAGTEQAAVSWRRRGALFGPKRAVAAGGQNCVSMRVTLALRRPSR